jgi:transposase InsO family protein
MVTGDLMFLEFNNNGACYYALIDSGAQLNVISSSLLQFCSWKVVNDVQVFSIAGVNGMKSKVIKWISMDVTLGNERSLDVILAVIDLPKSTIIFGMPFLNSIKARVDFSSSILHIFNSPVMLLRVPREKCSNVNVTLLPQMTGKPTLTLSPDQRTALFQLLAVYQNVWKNEKRGCCKAMEHTIRVTTKHPISSKPRSYCEDHVKAIQHDIELMMKDQVIRPSMSPYSSEVVMVKKKTGEYRMCIDYRELNKHTVPDKYPLPKIADLLRSVKGAKYFVALDLRSGYWQIPMEEDSIRFTAFRCPQGLYEFTVMPFGLTNAPSTFQRSMDFLLGDLKYHGASVYLDDILIYGNTFESCVERLEVVLRRLDKAGLTINMEKCKFFPKEIEYLGHILVDGQLLPNRSRVATLRHIKPAQNLTELRSILGMFGYYQIFIPNYADIVLPLTNALKGLEKRKDRITWTNDMQLAVEKLASLLGESVLTIPVDGDEYRLETDASDRIVAGILSVKRNGDWVPIEFMSKKLSGPQIRWPVREKEAFAIIHSLQKFDCFLRSRPFVVHTDHQSLQWILSATTGKIARWACRLSEYDMKVFWKKGKEIAHVDFFSRQVEPEVDVADRMIYMVTTDANPLPTIEEILKEQQSDSRPSSRGYITRGRVTYYRNGIWVPAVLRTRVISACHLLPPFCHSGTRKTKSTILRVFNWPGIHEDVQRYIQGCLSCQRLRPGLERIQGLLKTHPVPGPFDVVYIDIWHCRFGGQSYSVLTMIDISTRWAEAEPILRHTGDVISESFLRCWVCRFGVPKVLVTDNEQAFASDILKRLVATLGTTQLRTTPYHPQGNALIESFHRMLNKRISLFDKNSSENIGFPTALQLILWSYRIVIHSTTRETPSFLVYGLDLRPPCSQDWRFDSPQHEKDRIVFLNIMREDIQYQAYQRRLQENTKKNTNRTMFTLEENQLVLLRSTPKERQCAATNCGQATKLVPRWSLPHRVLHVYPGGQRALVRNLVTRYTRDAHITDIRLIEKPADEVQRTLWEQEVHENIPSMFESKEREKILRNFWEEIEYPQRTMAL